MFAPCGLLDMLSQHVATQGVHEQTAWLCTGRDGKPLHQNVLSLRWARPRNTVNPAHLRLHDLRHYYASGLIASGCDVVQGSDESGPQQRRDHSPGLLPFVADS